MSVDTALVSEGIALVSEDTALVSEDTVLVSWFSPCPLLCYVCLGPDTVLHSGGFRSCSSSRSSLLRSRCVPFHCRHAGVAKRLHGLDHCWQCNSWTSCSRPSLYYARCRLCPGSAQRCPWRHYRCSSWTSFSRPSLCYARCRFLSGQCAALPVETL